MYYYSLQIKMGFRTKPKTKTKKKECNNVLAGQDYRTTLGIVTDEYRGTVER
jgi:hypothetical protein